MSMKKLLEKQFKFTASIIKSEGDVEGTDFYAEGYAATSDLDRQGDIIVEKALRKAAKKLTTVNSTAFFGHDYDLHNAVGKVVKATVDENGLKVKIFVSSASQELRTKIQEGVISKFSIGGRVLRDTVLTKEEAIEQELITEDSPFDDITLIEDMELFEVSFVGVPANPAAFMLGSFSKALTGIYKGRGDGQGNGGAPQGDGGADECVCPDCGKKVAKKKGTPCKDIKCPDCDTLMEGHNTKSETKEKKIVINVKNINKLDKSADQIDTIRKNATTIDRFLGTASYKQKTMNTSHPYFKMALVSKAIKEVIASDWKVKQIIDISWSGKPTRPTYSYLETSKDSKEELLVNGFMFINNDEGSLVLNIYPRMWDFATDLYYKSKDSELAIKFMKSLNLWMKDHNIYKNQKITPRGHFLDYSDKGFEELKIEADKKKAIQVGALDFFQKQEVYKKNKIPYKRGLIFAGEPGTGKTFTGKILMSNTKSTFIWVTSGMVQYASDVEYLFRMAKELAPCILFAEDIDDYLKEYRVIDTLKTQMDGLDNIDGIVTILCTNYPEDIPAALIDRPSRFDDIIKFDLPNPQIRYDLLMSYTKSQEIDNKSAILKQIAMDSEGLTGAHLKEVVVYSILLASDDNRDTIIEADIVKALNKVLQTRKLITSMTDKKKYVEEVTTKYMKTINKVKSLTDKGGEEMGKEIKKDPIKELKEEIDSEIVEAKKAEEVAEAKEEEVVEEVKEESAAKAVEEEVEEEEKAEDEEYFDLKALQASINAITKKIEDMEVKVGNFEKALQDKKVPAAEEIVDVKVVEETKKSVVKEEGAPKKEDKVEEYTKDEIADVAFLLSMKNGKI